MSKPHVKFSDMTAEISGEAQELVTMAMDKYVAGANWEAAAKLIKESMDKKFGLVVLNTPTYCFYWLEPPQKTK